MRVTVLDLGVGNLHSVLRGLAVSGVDARRETDPSRALDTDALLLPGVGAFAPAAARLRASRAAIRDAIVGGMPTLGICLGMQLLFERSAEGEGDGIGVIEGDVIRLRANRLPQMGWNSIDERRDPLFLRSGLCDGYYANSFVCQPRDSAVVVARSTHEAHTFVAAVRMGPCIGVQFHPEKSGQPGLRFVQQWVHEARLATGMTIRETRT